MQSNFIQSEREFNAIDNEWPRNRQPRGGVLFCGFAALPPNDVPELLVRLTRKTSRRD